jgi:hypothetical protein
LLVLNRETWRSVEAQSIISNSDFFIIEAQKNEAFQNIHSLFIQLALESNSNTHASSDKTFNRFFTELIHQISSCAHSEIERRNDLQLIEAKILYDMLRFSLRYYSQNLSIPLIKNQFLYEIKVFEEAVGLLGSSAHMFHVKSKEIFNGIKKVSGHMRKTIPEKIEKHQENIFKYLTDSNQNRESLCLSSPDQEEIKLESKLDLRYQEKPELMIEYIISHYLSSGLEELENSTMKFKEKYQSYHDSIKLYKLHMKQLTSFDDIGSFLDGAAGILSQLEIHRVQEMGLNYLLKD